MRHRTRGGAIASVEHLADIDLVTEELGAWVVIALRANALSDSREGHGSSDDTAFAERSSRRRRNRQAHRLHLRRGELNAVLNYGCSRTPCALLSSNCGGGEFREGN